MIPTIAAALGGYALGSLSAAYYLVRWRTGRDVRRVGSGTAGATNAGRLLGRGAYVVVALLDLAKGAAAVAVGAWLAGPVGAAAAMVAAVAGHIWPPQLGFRGGKGVATAFGGVLAFRPVVALAALAAFGLLYLLTRRYRSSGVLAVAVAPAAAWWWDRHVVAMAAVTAVVALVLLAHWLRRRPPEDAVPA